MRTPVRWLLKVLVGTTVILAATGCETTSVVKQGHVEAVQAANQRWASMRAGIMFDTAQRQFDAGDLEQAEKSITEAVAGDPQNPQVIILAGRIAIERGQLETAYNLLQKAIQIRSDLAEAHYYQGLVLQRWQQYDAALVAYEKARTLAGDQVAYLLATAEMLIQLHQYDQALDLLQSKLTYFDQNVALRLTVAQVYRLKDDPAHAADFFAQALMIKPDDMQIAQDLIEAQFACGKAQDAVARLEDLLADPQVKSRSDLQRLLARGYEMLGQPNRAKTVYLELTRHDPRDADAWYRLGALSWALQDAKGALWAAQRCLAATPNHYQAQLLRGMAEQKLGEPEQAARSFAQAADLAPQEAQPLILQGLVLEQAGHPQEAAQAYTQALARQPDQESAKRLLARLETTPH